MDRCNLTVLLLKGQEDLSEFLAFHSVEVICSLPYFQERETDRQRGEGVFQRSIEALRRLNALGYGMPSSGLVLNLVHNPVGAFLPPAQAAIPKAGASPNKTKAISATLRMSPPQANRGL